MGLSGAETDGLREGGGGKTDPEGRRECAVWDEEDAASAGYTSAGDE